MTRSSQPETYLNRMPTDRLDVPTMTLEGLFMLAGFEIPDLCSCTEEKI